MLEWVNFAYFRENPKVEVKSMRQAGDLEGKSTRKYSKKAMHPMSAILGKGEGL